ncbi:MAG: TIGR00725 family protein, partial [Candidatus Hydrothermarchaeota archaeon]|nr:TIGR00725 family protein [Candidatus Hydrothermarchaeota archaeon]
MIQIGVVGGGDVDDETQALAGEVGREIARSGNILLCGGLSGVMEASAKGAKEEGGLTVAILPGTSKEEASPYMDVKIVTAMSHARNAIIARSADALIAVDGELGTLSEIALALKIDKPVIVLKNMAEIFRTAEMIKKNNLHFAKDA